MPKRESGASRTDRDPRVTPQSVKAGKKNLAKGRAAMDAQRAKAKEEGLPPAGERWRMLLSGTLKVSDLDDDEIRKMRLRGADGGFGGRRPALPSHIAEQFSNEQMRRIKSKVRAVGLKAAEGLVALAEDPETSDAVRKDCYRILLEHAIGKAPQHVTVTETTGSTWDDLTMDGLPIDRADI